jgi:hypothetical protein
MSPQSGSDSQTPHRLMVAQQHPTHEPPPVRDSHGGRRPTVGGEEAVCGDPLFEMTVALWVVLVLRCRSIGGSQRGSRVEQQPPARSDRIERSRAERPRGRVRLCACEQARLPAPGNHARQPQQHQHRHHRH